MNTLEAASLWFERHCVINLHTRWVTSLHDLYYSYMNIITASSGTASQHHQPIPSTDRPMKRRDSSSLLGPVLGLRWRQTLNKMSDQLHQLTTTMKIAVAVLPQANRMNFTIIRQSQQISLPARRDHDHVWITAYTTANATKTPTAIVKSLVYLSSSMVYFTRKLTCNVTCRNNHLCTTFIITGTSNLLDKMSREIPNIRKREEIVNNTTLYKQNWNSLVENKMLIVTFHCDCNYNNWIY